MSSGDSILFTTVMTLLDEVKRKEQKNTSTDTQPVENNINSKFTFESLKSKDKLISLADTLFAKADASSADVASESISGKYTSLVISCLITEIIYESVKSSSADYRTKSGVYSYAIKYCNVQTDFTWDALNSTADPEMKNVMKELSDMALNLLFITSTVNLDYDLNAEFIKILTTLMMHLEDSIEFRFPTFKCEKRLPALALDNFMAALNREILRMGEECRSTKWGYSTTD